MTVFDLLTLAIFAGLIVLFLQRSIEHEAPKDRLWQYLLASCGCAIANYAGNKGYSLLAVLVIVAVLVFVNYVLRPFANLRF